MNSLLKSLCQCYGPSGHEEAVAQIIKEEAKPYADNIYTDTLGNLVVHKKGAGKKLMLAAHMDQIGMIVTHINKEGFLYFSNVGGVSPFSVIGKAITFKNGTRGIISAEPKIEKKDLKLSNMFIDIGANTKEEAQKLVSVGDVCVYYGESFEMGDLVCSKALDNRVGCFVMLEVLKKIKTSPYDLYFVFSVQEELGLRGAKTIAYAIEPAIGLSVDVTSTGDVPNCEQMDIKLGGGAAIKIKDASIIAHKKVKDWLIDNAKNNNIAYQLEVLLGGGTDGGAIHTTKGGVITGGVSIPTRYIHSSVECANKKDIDNTIELLVKALAISI